MKPFQSNKSITRGGIKKGIGLKDAVPLLKNVKY